jgi:hypothetical protein
MDERLRTIEREQGVFLLSEALDLDYDKQAVAVALRLKLWKRVRHGAYCFYDTWESADPVRRHLIVARAVMRSLGGRVVLSHTSSLVAQGIPVWGSSLARVHVTRIDGGVSRVERDVRHHVGSLDGVELVERFGIPMTPPTRAVLETGTVESVESTLVSADATLHLGLSSRDELDAGYRLMERWPGAQRLQLVVALANGLAASPGESRSRYLFWTQGLPAPVLQFPVYDERGVLVGISDFAWPGHGVLGEFDGKAKYGRLLRPGQEPADAVFAEKRREDRLREVTGFVVVRLAWEDLERPVETARRFLRHLGRAS